MLTDGLIQLVSVFYIKANKSSQHITQCYNETFCVHPVHHIYSQCVIIDLLPPDQFKVNN